MLGAVSRDFVDLRLAEAVDLGHAWVQHLAEATGTRILFLKGPALQRHGLRSERTSSDVDVLVEPTRFAELCGDLEKNGWVERKPGIVGRYSQPHARSFARAGWPCDVDMHTRFPGFLKAPDEVFEVLWARRTYLVFAGQPCPVPDRMSSVLILALHSLRSGHGQSRHANELSFLTSVRFAATDLDDLYALSNETGSNRTLSTVLHHLGLPVPAEREASPELRQWRERIDSGYVGVYPWLLAFRHAPSTARPQLIAQSIWPARVELLRSHPEVVDTVPGRLKGRIARWGRGIRSLPQAVRAIAQHR